MSVRVAAFVLSLLAVSSLLAGSASAQTPQWPEWNTQIPPCLPYAPANTIPWPGGAFGDQAGFGRTLVAELDGDFAPEAVVACSGVMSVLWNVAVFDLPHRVHFAETPPLGTVADIAVLPGDTPSGTDALLATDGYGLRRITYSGGALHGEVPLAAGAWINAYPLRAEQLNGGGGLDIVGVATDHRTIVTLYREASGYSAGPTFSAPSNVRDVAAVDWDGDGVRELVALTLRGLVVYRLVAGPPIAPVMHLDSTGCITRFTAPGAPGGELLAWSRTTAGVPKLKVLGSIGTTLSEVTLEFPTLCDQTALPTLPVALVAGDYDGENGEELLIAHEADHTAIVLANTGQSPWFVTNNEGRFDVIALTGLMSSQPNVGIPAFAQVDDQTAEDIVIPTGSYVEVFTSLPHIRALGSTFYRSSDIVMRESEYGADVDVDTLPSGELRFAFWIPGTAPYHLYTHLKVTIWHQDSPGASNYVESQALYRRYHPLVLPPNIEANQQQWVPLELGFPDGGCWNPLEYYYTQFRFVKLDEVPEPDVEVAASPTFTGGFTLKKICGDMYDMTFYDYLRQRGIPDTDFLVFGDNDLDGVTWPLNGSTFVGAYVPMSSQPPFQENVVLTFPPLGVGRDTARVGEPAPPP